MVTGCAWRPARISRASSSMACTQSLGQPSVRANTLVLPAGMGASAAPVPTRAPAASAAVPSPPMVTTVSAPCFSHASCASSAA